MTVVMTQELMESDNGLGRVSFLPETLSNYAVCSDSHIQGLHFLIYSILCCKVIISCLCWHWGVMMRCLGVMARPTPARGPAIISSHLSPALHWQVSEANCSQWPVLIPGPRVTPSDQRWVPIMGHLRGQLIMSWHHYNIANIIVWCLMLV